MTHHTALRIGEDSRLVVFLIGPLGLGLPSLTAVAVILTGIIGAMLGTGLLRLIRVRDSRASGLAIGVASHGIGTARALQVSQVAGAFSGLAMGLNALATALLVPLLVRLLV